MEQRSDITHRKLTLLIDNKSAEYAPLSVEM